MKRPSAAAAGHWRRQLPLQASGLKRKGLPRSNFVGNPPFTVRHMYALANLSLLTDEQLLAERRFLAQQLQRIEDEIHARLNPPRAHLFEPVAHEAVAARSERMAAALG
jgi:hypothetical protein